VALHRRLAFVPGDVELWPNLTGGEAIDLFARLRGGLDKQRRDALCERFDLDPTKKGRTYSKGNRQKVALISALASEVELLLLDEPTAGLDPLMEAVFQDCIREAKAAGTTVLLSSHILAQVEVLADRISIIRQGRIVESGSLDELRHLHRTTVTAETSEPADALARQPGVHHLEAVDGHVRFEVDGEHTEAVMRHLGELGVRSIVAHPPTLEQLLLRHYGDDVGSTSEGGGVMAPVATTEPRRVTGGPPDASGSTGPFTGVWTLVRFMLRRDRIRLPAWAAGLGVFVLYLSTALPAVYETEADLRAAVGVFADPVGRMLVGPGYGFDAASYERFVANGYGLYFLILASLMSLLLVTRHTRVEEQTGRAELVRANVVGRHASLSAALIMAVISNLAVVLVVAVAMLASGFGSQGSCCSPSGSG
jgi:ABC-2 type transport system ATP-binding protein